MLGISGLPPNSRQAMVFLIVKFYSSNPLTKIKTVKVMVGNNCTSDKNSGTTNIDTSIRVPQWEGCVDPSFDGIKEIA